MSMILILTYYDKNLTGISCFGGLMICSSWGTTPLEEIAENRGDATLWFQVIECLVVME